MSPSDNRNWPDLLLRCILSLLYMLVSYPVLLLMVAIILVQWLVHWLVLWGRLAHSLRPLDDFSAQLVGFFTQVLHYVFFLSEKRPFPFNPINPSADAAAASDDSAGATPSAKVRVEVVSEPPKTPRRQAKTATRKKKAAK